MSLVQTAQRAQRDMTDDRRQLGKTLVNGITVAYEDVGKGDNVLVLVHGHPFNRTMWQPQMELFNRPRTRRRPRCESGSSSERLVETECEPEYAEPRKATESLMRRWEGCYSAAQAANLIEPHRLGPGFWLDR
jgi:pimeloyl-ACP methyl ester carboxylesterase